MESAMYFVFELRQTDSPSLILSKSLSSQRWASVILPWEGFYLPPKADILPFRTNAYRRDDKHLKTKMEKNMKNEKENTNNEVVIILPEPEVPPIKRITIFLLGVSSALLMSAFINFNENLGLLALGILLFLFIFDEGFRRIF